MNLHPIIEICQGVRDAGLRHHARRRHSLWRSHCGKRLPVTADGVVSFIGLAGAWAGTGSLSCSPELAYRICAQMLMCEATAINEEVLDTVAELTNMIVGSVKAGLEQQLGRLGLSIPTVAYGRNFKAKSAGSTEWIVIPVLWEDQTLLVKLCLEPKDQAAHVLFHTSSASSSALRARLARPGFWRFRQVKRCL